jgi:proteasome beta subunit
MRKVFPADDHSAIAISGAAGPAMELAKVFATELEHYEKIEGVALSLDGKANKLATMVRANLDVAMAGLAVIPLFAGYDTEATDADRAGRIISFDPTGGRYEENAGYHAIGSGSLFARSALKKLYDPDADADGAVRAAIEALYDAADDDTATGGPDLVRRIFPTVITITGERGAVQLSDDETAAVAESVIADRTSNANRSG